MLKIYPMNEPWGEGNGWNDCADNEASAFFVARGENDDANRIESFDTRAKAEEYIRNL